MTHFATAKLNSFWLIDAKCGWN